MSDLYCFPDPNDGYYSTILDVSHDYVIKNIPYIHNFQLSGLKVGTIIRFHYVRIYVCFPAYCEDWEHDTFELYNVSDGYYIAEVIFNTIDIMKILKCCKKLTNEEDLFFINLMIKDIIE
jgi:hypothetical protein